MKIHHLNGGTCCPLGGRLFDGTSHGLVRGHIVCDCLLIETAADLVLVDTGFGRGDIARPKRLSAFFMTANQPQLRIEGTAYAQVRGLGFIPADVRHILITYLEFDHAGGLEDFPNATVHLHAREIEVADERRGGAFVGTRRYRPTQWDEVSQWKLYPAGRGEHWNGFDLVRDLDGLPPEILLVPLAGHTWGHCGIAADTGKGWMLHAGDAYFHRDEISSSKRQCPPGMRAYQTMMEVDRSARLGNPKRLRDLASGGSVDIFCAHDPEELRLRQTAFSAGKAHLPT